MATPETVALPEEVADASLPLEELDVELPFEDLLFLFDFERPKKCTVTQ